MRNAAGWLAAWVLATALSPPGAVAANRLEQIRSRGTLNCGIWPYVPGFAAGHDGQFAGFDVDTCRAVAAAILCDATKVAFVTLAHVRQLAERPDVDLAVRRLTWTPGREDSTGMAFGPVTFYDGQGFLVPKASGIRSAAGLAGERICVIDMERHTETLDRHFRDSGRRIRIVPVASDSEAEDALRHDRCRAYSADISWLAAARSTFMDGPRRYDILADTISKEPLAPLMRAEDTDLLRVVRWTIFTMIEAEELGVDSRNVAALGSDSPRVRDFLAIDPGAGTAAGAGSWVRSIIAGVGNYGEMFDRNLGAASPIRLDRGLNRLWNRGGLIYAPPLDR